MSSASLARWCLFCLYVGLFITFPLAVLFNAEGAIGGGLLTIAFLTFLGWRGTRRILRRLAATPLAPAECPALYHAVSEICRRLRLARPEVAVIEVPAINAAVFGYVRHAYVLVLTRGFLERLTRDEQVALIARELYFAKRGAILGHTWFAQLLSILDRLSNAQAGTAQAGTLRRQYPFSLFLRQVFLYPLTLIPAALLLDPKSAEEYDRGAVLFAQEPKALSEAFRKVEATRERFPFFAPLSTRHLFVMPPPTLDPLARVFFDLEPLSERISAIEALDKVVVPS